MAGLGGGAGFGLDGDDDNEAFNSLVDLIASSILPLVDEGSRRGGGVGGGDATGSLLLHMLADGAAVGSGIGADGLTGGAAGAGGGKRRAGKRKRRRRKAGPRDGGGGGGGGVGLEEDGEDDGLAGDGGEGSDGAGGTAAAPAPVAANAGSGNVPAGALATTAAHTAMPPPSRGTHAYTRSERSSQLLANVLAEALEPEREPLGGERRAATAAHLSRKLLSRPKPEELLTRHLLRGSHGADPSLAATHEAVVRQVTIDHLSRRLRDRASLTDLVTRGILLPTDGDALTVDASGTGGAHRSPGDGGGDDDDLTPRAPVVAIGAGGEASSAPASPPLPARARHGHVASAFAAGLSPVSVGRGPGVPARDHSRSRASSAGVSDGAAPGSSEGGVGAGHALTGGGPHPHPHPHPTPTARRAAAAASVLEAKLQSRPSLQQLLAAHLIRDVMMWTQIELEQPSLPQARNCHTLTLAGRHVVLLGGYAQAECTMIPTLLDVGASRWHVADIRSSAAVPVSRYAHSAVLHHRSGCIAVFGGYGGGAWQNDVWLLDTAAVQAHSGSGGGGSATGVTSPTGSVAAARHGGGAHRAVTSSPVKEKPSPVAHAGGAGAVTLPASLPAPAAPSHTGRHGRSSSGASSQPAAYRTPTPSAPTSPALSAAGSPPAGSGPPSMSLPAPHAPPVSPRLSCTWLHLPGSDDKPRPRAAHSAVMFGDVMVVFGGNDGAGLYSDVWCCTLVMPTGPAAASVAASGGSGGGGVIPSAALWSRPNVVGPAPTPRSGHTAVAHGRRMLVFGGGEGWGADTFNDLHILDTDIDVAAGGGGGGGGGGRSFVWLRPAITGTPPSPRTGHSACMVAHNMLVFGGGDSKRALNDLFVFDSRTSAWTRPADTGAVPGPRSGHTATGVGSFMVVFGGCTPEGACFQDLFVLDSRFTYYAPAAAPAAAPVAAVGASAAGASLVPPVIATRGALLDLEATGAGADGADPSNDPGAPLALAAAMAHGRSVAPPPAPGPSPTAQDDEDGDDDGGAAATTSIATLTSRGPQRWSGRGDDMLAPLVHNAPSRRRRGFNLKAHTLEMLSAALADMSDADGGLGATDASSVDGEDEGVRLEARPALRVPSAEAGDVGGGGGGALMPGAERGGAANVMDGAGGPHRDVPTSPSRRALPMTAAPGLPGSRVAVLVSALNRAVQQVREHTAAGGADGLGRHRADPIAVPPGEVARRVAALASRIAAAGTALPPFYTRASRPVVTDTPPAPGMGRAAHLRPAAAYDMPPVAGSRSRSASSSGSDSGSGGDSGRAPIRQGTAPAGARRSSAHGHTPHASPSHAGPALDAGAALSFVRSLLRVQLREDEARYHALSTALEDWRRQRVHQTHSLLRVVDKIGSVMARTAPGAGGAGGGSGGGEVTAADLLALQAEWEAGRASSGGGSAAQ